jgi:uncharacterized membrane protein
MIMTQNRFKSKVLWASVAAQIISILTLTGVIDVGAGETFNQVIGGVLQLLVLFGVLNNPTDSANM